MTLEEAAKDLNKMFKSEQEKQLLDRIDELEKKIKTLEEVAVNLIKRLDYIEINAIK